MKINLDFVDSIEYSKKTKKSLNTQRTYYLHQFVIRGDFPTITISASSFQDFGIKTIKEGQVPATGEAMKRILDRS